jgi:uncharacterized protein (TIGR02271 family)
MTMGRSEHDRTNTGAYNYADRLVAGADVYGSDDEKIGTIADVGQNYFLVQKGWLFIKDLYLPTSTIARADGDTVYLSLTKHEAEQMGRDELPSADDAWYGTRSAGYATTDTDVTTNRTGYTTDRTAGYTDREVGRGVREGEEITVPVVEERLKAGVRETEAGRARVVKDVRQERQSIDVPVEREEVYVTERAVDRPATEADLAMRERDIEVPLREQEVVTSKEARVVGEVNVRKDVKRDTERVTDTVRREEVHVEGAESDRVHTEGLTGAQRRRYDAMSAAERRRYDAMSATERAAFERDYDARGSGKTVTDTREYDDRGNLVDREHYEERGTTRDR